MARKASKYAHVVDRLPKLIGIEPERRDVVEAVKAEILAAPMPNEFTVSRQELDEAVELIGDRIKDILRIEKRATAGRPWATEFARVYAELRGIKDRMAEWQSSLNLLLDAYQWLMIEQMEVEGVTSMRLASGQPISTWQEPYAQVNDKEAFRLWCIAQGLEKSMHLWPSTTQALVRNMLLEGQSEPPGVEVFSKTMVRLGAE